MAFCSSCNLNSHLQSWQGTEGSGRELKVSIDSPASHYFPLRRRRALPGFYPWLECSFIRWLTSRSQGLFLLDEDQLDLAMVAITGRGQGGRGKRKLLKMLNSSFYLIYHYSKINEPPLTAEWSITLIMNAGTVDLWNSQTNLWLSNCALNHDFARVVKFAKYQRVTINFRSNNCPPLFSHLRVNSFLLGPEPTAAGRTE